VKFSGKHYAQTADIDLGARAWTPIGYGMYIDDGRGISFSGHFNGNGHSISNLKIGGVAIGVFTASCRADAILYFHENFQRDKKMSDDCSAQAEAQFARLN
jgi:hypothetical protein